MSRTEKYETKGYDNKAIFKNLWLLLQAECAMFGVRCRDMMLKCDIKI